MKTLSVIIYVGTALFLLACSRVESERIPISTKSAESRALFWEGMSLCERFHLDAAREKMLAAIELDSEFALGYLGLAMCELNHGAQAATLQQADELSRPVASKVAPSIILGINVLEDRNEELIGHAGKLMNKVSPGERLWISGTRCLLESNLDGAAANFEKLASMYPNDPLAHKLLGDCYLRFEDASKAVPAYQRALTLDSTRVCIYNTLGYEYQLLGETAKAEEMFRLYAHYLPNEPNPLDSYGEFLLRNGRYEESLEQYRRALEIDSHFMNARVGVATNLIMLGRHEDARREIRQQMIVSQSTAELDALLLMSALSFLYQGQPAQCLEELNVRAQYLNAATDPVTVAQNLNIRGEVLSLMGRYDEAEREFLQSTELLRRSKLPNTLKENNNLHHEIRLALYVDAPQGNFAAAERKLNNVDVICSVLPVSLNRSKLETMLHALRGAIALGKKDYQFALQEFSLGNRNSAATAYFEGIAYEGMEENEKASECFKSALQIRRLFDLPHALVYNNAKAALERLSRPVA